MKKLLALLMAAAMLALGGAAFAEEMPENFRITLSDPYLEMGPAGQPKPDTVIDLGGLSLALEGATAGDVAGLTATLLTNGIPAMSGMALVEGEEVVLALDGMQHALRMPMEAVIVQNPDLGSLNATMTPGFDAALKFAENIELTDAGTEEVEFYGGGRLEAKKQTFSISDEQFDELFKALGVTYPDDMHIDVDAVLWVDETEVYMRTEAMYHVVSGEETIDMPLVMLGYAPNADTMYMNLNLDMQELGGMDGIIMLAPSKDVPGYPDIFVDFTIETSDEEGKLEMVGWPAKAGDDTEYTVSLSITDSVTDVTIGGHALMGEAGSSYEFSAYAPEGYMKLAYDAKSVENGYDGTLTLSFKDENQFVNGRMGVGFTTDGDIAMPDLSSFEPVDMTSITEAEQEALAVEAQTVLYQAMGALMQVPGVQELLLSGMS